MTTIVATANHPAIYSDSRMTFNSSNIYTTRKIFAVDDTLVGVCGCLISAAKFVEWMRLGCPADDKPDFDGEFDALQVSQGRQITMWCNKLVPLEVGEPFVCLGSGGAFAAGAMAMGASPADAIEIAKRFDSGSGGDVVSMHLGGGNE